MLVVSIMWELPYFVFLLGALSGIVSIPIDNGLLLKVRPSNLYDEVCSAGTVDLVFIVDGSSSIGDDNFEFIRRFLVNVVDGLPDGSKVAAVQFSGTVRAEFSFDTYSNLEQVKGHLRTLPYLRGTTRLGNAIDYSLRTVLTEAQGDRADISDIIIVITDGRSSDEPADAAKRLRDHVDSAHIIAIGVTDFVDDSQLLAITGDEDSVFKVQDFAQLDQQLHAAIASFMSCTRVQSIGGV